MQTFRGPYTVGEYKAKYIFSHLRGNPGYNADDFCFGDTELYKAHRKYTDEMTVFDIYHFLIGVEEYFKWESLIGTPWRYLSNIIEYKIQPGVGAISLSVSNKYYKHVVSKLTEFNYSIIPLSDGKYTIKLSPDTEEKIRQILFDRIVSLNKQTSYLGRSMGDVFGNIIQYSDEDLREANTEVNGRSHQAFKFKGEYITSTVSKKYENIAEMEGSFPISVHPELVKKVCSIFEKDYINYLEKSNLKIL
jgi:hypothetical protein